MIKPLLILAAGVALFATLILLPGSCTVIDPGHRGVSITLGKVNQTVLYEGVNFKKPFVESIESINVQQQTLTDGQTPCFSSDTQTVIIGYSVLYRIPELKVVTLYQNYKGDPFNTLVRPRLEDAMKQVVAQYRAEDIIKSREKIRTDILALVRKNVEGLVDVIDIPITNIDLSDEIEKAIELKQVTEQQALAKQYEVKKAEAESEITIIGAKAEAESVKIKGEALKQSREVIDLEIVKKWNGISPTTVVVGDGKSGANIVLPIK